MAAVPAAALPLAPGAVLSAVLDLLKRLIPGAAPVGRGERILAPLGALAGILLTGLLTAAVLGADGAVPLLVAPMGASAVLLFAVPASPLAQPWSILGGNTVSALVGVAAGAALADHFAAGAVAVGGAIAAMMALRCLHPPGGAVALTAVLGGAAVQELGFAFALWPVALNSLLLLASAVAFHRLAGRRYPHLAVPAAPPAVVRGPRLGIAASDLDAVLAERRQLLDVDRADLEEVLHAAERRAWRRRTGGLTCGEIMLPHPPAVAPRTAAREALRLLRRHRLPALPVIGAGGRLAGMVTEAALLDAVWRTGPAAGVLRIGPAMRVAAAMRPPPPPVRPETPAAELPALLPDEGGALPVVAADGRLLGIVGERELLAALLHAPATEAAARAVA